MHETKCGLQLTNVRQIDTFLILLFSPSVRYVLELCEVGGLGRRLSGHRYESLRMIDWVDWGLTSGASSSTYACRAGCIILGVWLFELKFFSLKGRALAGADVKLKLASCPLNYWCSGLCIGIKGLLGVK